MTTYSDNMTFAQDITLPANREGYVVEDAFCNYGSNIQPDKTMHGSLVYEMAEDESHEELLPDSEVYEAARRIDEVRWFYRFIKRAFGTTDVFLD